MSKYTKAFIIAIFFVFCLYHPSHAQRWEKVADNGFGNSRNSYAWSMETFKGELYVGSLNLQGGAEIWCSNSGANDSWQQVYKAIFSRNTGVRCLYSDNQEVLYACTSNNQGTQILRATDGRTWTTVAQRGLENRNNTTIRCMVRFEDYLYAGMGCNGAKLYRSKKGFDWELVHDKPGFESTKVLNPRTGRLENNNLMIGELAVFKGYLYAFTWTNDGQKGAISKNVQNSTQKNILASDALVPFSPVGAFEVWRSKDGINWEKVVGLNDPYGNGLGFSGYDPDNLDNNVVPSTTVFQERLYLGTENDSGKTAIWRTANGTHWKKVLDFEDLGEKCNYYIWSMLPFNDQLFVGTLNLGSTINPSVTGAQIWVSDSGDPGSFYNLVHNGFDGKKVTISPGFKIPKNMGIRTFGSLNDTLFAGTATYPMSNLGLNVGCEIWKMIP